MYFVVIYAFFGVNFILQKFCSCKKDDKYQVCIWWGVPAFRIQVKVTQSKTIVDYSLKIGHVIKKKLCLKKNRIHQFLSDRSEIESTRTQL